MTIEDRVRRVLADAVAEEPPPRGAPLDYALGRRRSRPVLAGAVAVLVVLGLVVAVAAVRGSDRPATGPTATTTVPATDSAMKKLGKSYEHHVYEGAGHGFLRGQEQADGYVCRVLARARPDPATGSGPAI